MARIRCSKDFWVLENAWVLLSNIMNPNFELNINDMWKKIQCNPYTFPLVTMAEKKCVPLSFREDISPFHKEGKASDEN